MLNPIIGHSKSYSVFWALVWVVFFVFNLKKIILRLFLMLDTKLQSEEFRFYFLFFLALTFLFSMLMPFSYSDLAIWIAEGRQILQQHSLYIRDAYSFNPTHPSAYPWLSSLFYHFLETDFSVESIFFLHRLIPVAVVAIWLSRYPQLIHKKNWFVLVICISGLSMIFVDRPALLALPFIPYFYDLIEKEEIYKNKVKALLLLVLWTNLHGSFLLFFIMLGYKTITTLLAQRNYNLPKDRFWFLAASFFATFINPWGFKIYTYAYETAVISKLRITEWQPVTLIENNNLSTDMLLFGLTLGGLMFFVIRQKKFVAFLSAPLLILIISAGMASRNLPLLFAVLPLFWGCHLAPTRDLEGFCRKPSQLKIIFNRAIVISFIAFGIFMFSSLSDDFRKNLPPRYAGKYDSTASFRIAKYLNQSSGKRIFNSWILGSFLIYSQNNKIFIDARNIIYPDHVYTDYVRIVNNIDNQAESALNQKEIDFVVSEKNKALADALYASSSWNFIMEENGFILFERK